jgi:hypothetical protein
MKTKTKPRISRERRLEDRAHELFPDLLGPAFEESPSGLLVPASSKIYGDDFDIVALMNEAKDPDTGLMRDLKIDDGDLHHASSYYDFVFNVLKGDAHPPWMMQMWIGVMLFAEFCPICSDKKWLSLDYMINNVDKRAPSEGIIENIKMLKHGVCPKCKRHKHDLIKNHGLRNYVELVNILGQRSGKSASAAGYSAYVTHRYLKFPKLATLTKAMQKSTELTATFVSLTFSKAFSLLWTPYINIVNESKWFEQYHECLNRASERYGLELYRKKDEFLKYYMKGLRIYPSGPKSQTLRGDTRFLAIIDELGLFPLPTGNEEEDEKSERANADEAHKSLSNSLATVQSVYMELQKKGLNAPPAVMMGVSSPISMRDKVMRLLADSRTDEGRKYILGVNLPTWKINPFLDRDSPMIAKAYSSNPEKAERDFGANPPRVSQTLIKPGQVPVTLFKHKNSHLLTYQYDMPGLIYAKVQRVYSPKFPSVVTIDAGHTNNSFTLTGGHFDFDRQKTVISTVMEIMCHDMRKVDFNMTYLHLILPILKDLNAVLLLADQWQSLDILSRAREDMGLIPGGKDKYRCVTKQYSPRRKDFDSLVSMMENGAYEFPFLSQADYDEVTSSYIDYTTLKDQAVKHLLLQMLTVKDVGVDKAPTKGEGFTDDIFRALVLTNKIHDEKVMQRLREAQGWMKEEGKSGMPMPFYASRG